MVFLFLFNVFFHFGPFTVDILWIFIYIPLFFLLCTFSLSNSITFEVSIFHLDGIILQSVNFQSWMQLCPHLLRSAYVSRMPPEWLIGTLNLTCVKLDSSSFSQNLLILLYTPLSISLNSTMFYRLLTRKLALFLFSCFSCFFPNITRVFPNITYRLTLLPKVQLSYETLPKLKWNEEAITINLYRIFFEHYQPKR